MIYSFKGVVDSVFDLLWYTFWSFYIVIVDFAVGLLFVVYVCFWVGLGFVFELVFVLGGLLFGVT